MNSAQGQPVSFEDSVWQSQGEFEAPKAVISATLREHETRGLAGEADTTSPASIARDAAVDAPRYEPPRLAFDFEDLPHSRFISLQSWRGIVLDVGRSEFTARLSDTTNGGPDEEATLFIEDVPDGDRDLLRPGAMFYLNLGYSVLRNGQRIRGISVRFRRLPPWDADEFLDARERAQARLKRIRSE
ncbi:MAG: hypothetical protein JXR37_30970 [Kiritimatiellae bacterium]|nr:hypothetical protein [Kiritimatiellia bacterium]